MDTDGRAAARARKRETREAWRMFAAMACSGVLYAVAGVVFVVLLAPPGRVGLVLCTVFLAAGIVAPIPSFLYWRRLSATPTCDTEKVCT